METNIILKLFCEGYNKYICIFVKNQRMNKSIYARIIFLNFLMYLSVGSNAQKLEAGFYATYEDYKNKKITEVGEFVKWKGNGYTSNKAMVFKTKNGIEKFKIKDSNYWGARDNYEHDYIFHNNVALWIIESGKIMFYGYNVYINRNDDGETLYWLDNSGFKLFVQKGENSEIRRVKSKAKIAELFSDDQELLSYYRMKNTSIFSTKVHNTNWDFIKQYNKRNK